MDLESALHEKQTVATLLGSGSAMRGSRHHRVAVGVATTAHSRDFRIAIRAQSQEDLDNALELQDEVRKATANELDIRITGPVFAGKPAKASVVAAAEYRLRIGASVSHCLGSVGTLGFFARRISDGIAGLVSNNHVLALGDRGKENDEIVHPGAADGGVRPLNVVGYLERGYPRLDADKPIVDCAFVRLRDGIAYDPVTIAPGLKLNPTPVMLRDQRDVLKRGRSTGITRGRITAFALNNFRIDYGSGLVVFDDQIEIRPTGETSFGEPGDSGSLVVNPEGHPVGLQFAGTHNGLISYANRIENVLSALGITVLT